MMAPRRTKRIANKSKQPTICNKPTNLFLFPAIVLLQCNVAIVEVGCGVWINSLTFIAHGLQQIVNSILLTSLTVSTFSNWRKQRDYSIMYVDFAVQINLIVGVVYFCATAVLVYLAGRDLINSSSIQRESLVYLIPTPGLFLNVVTIYVILNGCGYLEEQSLLERKAIERIKNQLVASVVGSTNLIIAVILVQCFEVVKADSLFSLVNGALMMLCAFALVMDSLTRIFESRKQSSVFTITTYIKNDLFGLTNILNV